MMPQVSARRGDRPNVLLCVWDSVRADALEPYGAPAGSTPATAALARSGSVAERAYAAAPWTVPSHAAMFTGLLPRAAGLARPPTADPASSAQALAALDDRLLASVFSRAGYATGAVSANLWLIAATGWGRGFESFESFWDHRLGGVEGKLTARARWLAGALSAGRDDGARAVGDVLARWAREPGDRPFLWFCNLVDAHSPYMPPRGYNPLGPIGRLRAAREAVAHTSFLALGKAALGVHHVPDGAIERIRSLYYAAVRYLDAWLGGVLETLEGAGLLDETLVMLTSDHGERLGEKGLVGHGFGLDHTLLRVPLIAAGPGADALPPGPVSLASVPRLLADAAGLADHPWHPDDLPQGVAVAHYEPPHGIEGPELQEVVSGWGVDPDALIRIRDRVTWASDGSWTMHRRTGPARDEDLDETFDLATDALEESPVDPKRCPPEVRERLEAALAHPANRQADLRAGAAESGLDAEPVDEAERARIEQQMRLLGYL